MLEQIRSLIAAALNEREAADEAVQAILESVETEGRTELSEAETAEFDEKRSALKGIDERIAELRQRESDLAELEESRSAADATRKALGVKTAVVSVKSEERTYRPDGDHDFVADAFRAEFASDYEARDRIQRSQAEVKAEYRSTTGNFGGLVVPQYLTSQFAPILRAGRPFLNAVSSLPLPGDGMTITVPRGNTGVSVAAQETQNTAVSNTTYAETDLTVPVRTYAGQQVVSRQSIDRGTGIGEILMADLVSAYATKLDADAINGAGSAGTHYGVINTTSVQTAAWTGTTGASLVTAIHNGIGKVNTSRLAAADLIVMHPRRWAWLCAQSDTAGRPLVNINGYNGQNQVGQGVAAGLDAVGDIAGVPVISDANVPIVLGASTDEDRIIITRRADSILMEDAGAPMGLRFEEVLGSSLSVQMVLFGYSAFTAGRYPVASCVLQGTGFKQVLS
jgi:HK97 family phage major capsid protein